MKKVIKSIYNRVILYGQEISLALVWFTFGYLGTRIQLISTISSEFPDLARLLDFSFYVAAFIILVSVIYPSHRFPAFIFSSFVSTGALIASLGITGAYFPVNELQIFWAILAFWSITLSIKTYYAWVDNDKYRT